MAMNSIAARLQRNSKSTQTVTDGEDTKTSWSTKEQLTFSALRTETDQAGVDEISRLRRGPKKVVDLENLKKKYSAYEGLGRRIAPRFCLKMTAVVLNHKMSFRTESINISESGVLLKDLLPQDMMKEPFEIVLIHEDDQTGTKTHLLFQGEAVGGPLRTPRITFKAAVEKSQERLLDLVQDLTPLACY